MVSLTGDDVSLAVVAQLGLTQPVPYWETGACLPTLYHIHIQVVAEQGKHSHLQLVCCSTQEMPAEDHAYQLWLRSAMTYKS